MTVHLLDENVLRELRPGGHPRVRAWHAALPDEAIRISVVTLFEKRRGWERRRHSAPRLVEERIAQLDALEASFSSRVVPIDAGVPAEWARLLGARDKHLFDRALAATARVHGFVLATRNVADMSGCAVRVVDPFRARPVVETV